MSGSSKNIVKLLVCKFDWGDCGGLCSMRDQMETNKKRITILVVWAIRVVWVVWLFRVVVMKYV